MSLLVHRVEALNTSRQQQMVVSEYLNMRPPLQTPEEANLLKNLILQMAPLCPRMLIKWPEKIDPRKMEHEKQLCFWINIHNALVMHVCSIFLAITTLNNACFLDSA